jgi:hypothetical protein
VLTPVFRSSAVALALAMNAATAQTAAPADSASPNDVRAVSIKSGRILLSSAANPGPVVLADGAYASSGGTVIVIVDGKIARVEGSSGKVTLVGSSRMNRQRVMLTPVVGALIVAVTPFALPSGTFRATDRVTFFRVVDGRVMEFTLPPKAP